jgi:RNA polymerase sigma factor (sigma-70 family)
MTSSHLDSGDVFESFRPLMLKALGHLARQGFVIPPQDAQDLLQSFFLSEWEPLQRTRDHDRPLAPYLFRAFANFARNWALRESRYRRVLENASRALGNLRPSEHSAWDVFDVNEALSRLSQPDRQVLQIYMKDQSQRSAAVALGVSRHEARQRIVEALGRFVVSLGHLPNTTEAGWDVARLMWGDQRSIEDCAIILQLDVAEVRRLHEHNLDVVGSILSRIGPHRKSR